MKQHGEEMAMRNLARNLSGRGVAMLTAAVLAVLLGGCASGPGTKVDEARARPAAARTHFEQQCAKAGEKIQKTVEGVEGIYLLKVRPAEINRADQFRLDDPYGRDFGGDEYIESFLNGSHDAKKTVFFRPKGSPPRIGYRFVEAHDPESGQRFRYTGGVRSVRKKEVHLAVDQFGLQRKTEQDLHVYEYAMDKQPAFGAPLRYGVTYEDISTREDRAYWIAGSSLKVIDLESGEIIAERIGYMMDLEQGLSAGGRAPWLMAADHGCMDFHRMAGTEMREPGTSPQIWQTLDFVSKVLRPVR